ncbi:MAG: hypothetical protein V9H26_08780 [Verrucomicrobiota bacterium]
METRSTEACTELTSHPTVRDLHRLTIPLIADETQTKALTAADSYSLDVFDDRSVAIAN